VPTNVLVDEGGIIRSFGSRLPAELDA